MPYMGKEPIHSTYVMDRFNHLTGNLARSRMTSDIWHFRKTPDLGRLWVNERTSAAEDWVVLHSHNAHLKRTHLQKVLTYVV
jgi:hypothetical protein